LKENGTYFTDQEEEEYYYELHQFFEWMSEQEEKEKQEKEWDRLDTDTLRFSK
jgi:hypothetical protein